MSFNRRKGKRDVGKSKTDNHKLKKNQYSFCKEEGHQKINCPRLKKEKGQNLEANFVLTDDGTDFNSSVFSLYTPSVCYSNVSEWILDTDSTYNVCPK